MRGAWSQAARRALAAGVLLGAGLAAGACAGAPVTLASLPGHFGLNRFQGQVAAAPLPSASVPTLVVAGEPVAAPSAVPTSAATPGPAGLAPVGGGSSGGGAAAVLPAPTTCRGRVVEAVVGGSEPAIAGATVTVHDAYNLIGHAVTGADGTFEVSVYGSSAQVVIAEPGHVTSAVAAWDLSPQDFHLRPAGASAPGAVTSTTVSGRVLDDQGQPVAGAVAVGGDAAGAHFGPVGTDADGTFSATLTASAPLDPGGLTLWAYAGAADEAGPTALGHARAVPAGGDLGDVRLVASDGLATLSPGGPLGARRASVEALDPAGVSLVLASWDEHVARPLQAHTFTLPDVRTTAHVTFADEDGHRSGWNGDVAAGQTAAPVLLDYPRPDVGQRLVDFVTWPGVTGADGYLFVLRPNGLAAAAWEGYTASPGLALDGWPGHPGDQVELLALAGTGSSQRELASLPAPRRLRLDPQAAVAPRWSSRIWALPP